MMQNSSYMPWSGNNNQIYKSLTELLNHGYLTHEVQHRESSPSIKVYTITEAGLAELKNWLLAAAEPPEFKKMFLVRLAGAGSLDAAELQIMLDRYEQEVRLQLAYHEEKKRRDAAAAGVTPRAACIRDMIGDNVASFYKAEVEWIQRLRQALSLIEENEEEHP
ncbi:helix-turn-helix transcriptional regulator [Paenibacillus hodogayensis]|uniref:Helix-turn-helix transcriptional regulator n=1 Tax=Paenibacillus hodogayensis TaxID=279208 RepID=A0ABV5VZX0_9BACL